MYASVFILQFTFIPAMGIFVHEQSYDPFKSFISLLEMGLTGTSRGNESVIAKRYQGILLISYVGFDFPFSNSSMYAFSVWLFRSDDLH